MAVELETIKPRKGTPTAEIQTEDGCGYSRGRKDEIDGITVWLKGQSPTGSSNYSVSPYNERAAYIISEILDLHIVPPTVLRLIDGMVASAQVWVDGECPRIPIPALLKAFDYIIQQGDRHTGNWLVRPDGGFWAIDNAFAFDYVVEKFSGNSKDLPDSFKLGIRKALENKTEFHRQLDNLIGRKTVTAVLKRIKIVLKELGKNKG